MATAPLFTDRELSAYLHYEVSVEDADIAERVVRGWLRSATGRDDWGDPVPDEVFSWAVELAAIAHENPNGALISTTTGATTDQFGSARRQEILNEAASSRTGGSGRAAPQGCFPAAAPWPDAAGATAPWYRP